ncbi:MAG: lytic transglycosylase domain-containing protein [Planctomycetota bacterium]
MDKRISSHLEIVRRWSRTYNLPVELVNAVIRAESGGKPNASSHKGAKGLMQVTKPAEAEVVRQFGMRQKGGEDRLFDPDYNVQIGTAYLRVMINRFKGDVYLALAAYNMGPTGLSKLLKKYRELPPRRAVELHAPNETKRYCRKIFELTGGRYASLPVSGS